MYLSRGVYTEGAPQGVVRVAEEASGRGIPAVAKQKESRIEEGYLMPDHVHMARLHPRLSLVALDCSEVGSTTLPALLERAQTGL